VEISVAVPNVTHAQSLVRRLCGALEATVKLDAGLSQIRMLASVDSHRAVLSVVNIVEDWLEQGIVDSAELSLGDRTCTLFGTGQIASSR
jgi:hypothetical protein